MKSLLAVLFLPFPSLPEGEPLMSFVVNVVISIAAVAAVIFSAYLTSWFAHQAVKEAKKAVEEAKRQNDIARFEKQLDLSDALREFRIAISEGPDYPDYAHWNFFRAAQLSEFYFPLEISDEYGDIYNHAHETKGLAEMLPLTDERNKELKQRCNDLSEIIRSYLKRANPAPVN